MPSSPCQKSSALRRVEPTSVMWWTPCTWMRAMRGVSGAAPRGRPRAAARLLDRELRGVGLQPGIEVLEPRVQLARAPGVARALELVAEDRLELEHVAEVVGAGEAERAVGGERHVHEA